ncbi:MAG: sulfite exporter TauE/SafE family protein [Bacteroidota bacterium]|nr:sulfite exporter TauE/SafE family protein [Bacteroidota bacterium]
MTEEIKILSLSVASIAFLHTLMGPDHYLPFIVLSKARKWSWIKTTWITIVCGIGHVGSSIAIALIGVALGFGISKINGIEGLRGNLAAWAFVIFGLIYFLWGLWRVYNKKTHKHIHLHKKGHIHAHSHTHEDEHNHTHNKNLTPWILFTIFVLGPCEPLIAIVVYPASEGNTLGLITVIAVFSFVTILTMLSIVLLAFFGINFLPLKKFEKYTHAIAGATILLSGLAILFLGL